MRRTTKIANLILPIILIFSLGDCRPVFAQEKLNWAQNKFGIHITSSFEDLPKAAQLINTNGGDWGWVTTVIREDELNQDHWQLFFDQCRRLHLIPLVRLATIGEGGYWRKPEKANVKTLADFLNRLNWPTQDKLIIVYNEPNRADEWGGSADPKEYFEVLDFAADYFHSLDDNFFIISAGLDLAAPNKPPVYISAESFYYQGFLYLPETFKKIDGLASHSYPNHGFSGSPEDTGKTSIRGYLWELEYLNSLGVNFDLPVFITETGWPHQEGNGKRSFYPAKEIVGLLKDAYQAWLNDDRILAITPFILNYPVGEFTAFSWLDENQQPYPQYRVLKDLNKPSQKPLQKETIAISKITISKPLMGKERIFGKMSLTNKGQSIWGENGKFCLNPAEDNQGIIYLSPVCLKDQELAEPNRQVNVEFEVVFSEESSEINFGWQNTGKVQMKKLPKFFWSKTIYPYQRSWLQKITGWLKYLRIKTKI